MNVDEILASPIDALDLPDGAIPLSVIMLVEYAEPGADESPSCRRLAVTSDEDLPPWTSVGMLRFACELEFNYATRDDVE